MSDDKAPAAPKKKGGGLKKILFFVLAPLLMIGGGVGAGVFAAGKGLVGGHKDGKAVPAEDPNRPKLVAKAGEHGSVPEGPDPVHPNPALYKSSYYPMEQPFTSNLRDTDGFLQIGLGVSTFYDSKVIDNLKDSDMPVRSAVLQVLAEQDADVLNTPQGKVQLRTVLKNAINGVLEQREGFGGVDDVYFTSFIIQ